MKIFVFHQIINFCFVLLCLVLFCFVLFCFVLFCFVLFCFVLFCFVLFCFVLFCIILVLPTTSIILNDKYRTSEREGGGREVCMSYFSTTLRLYYLLII
jgi:hypothetical protein